MKKLLFFVTCCVINIAIFASPIDLVNVRAISFEKQTVDGTITIVYEFSSEDSITVDTAFSFSIPENWVLNSPQSISTFDLVPGDTVLRSFTFDYLVSDLPFFPVELKMNGTCQAISEASFSEIVQIYFTPYQTVEVWSYFDFVHLDRDWYVPTLQEPERTFIHPDSIPISNIPEGFDPSEDWEELFQHVHIEGLAYGVPMLAIHPDSLALDTTDVGLVDSVNRADGCGLGRRRYIGTIDGYVSSEFEDVSNNSYPILPLEGLVVQIWEDDAFWFSDMIGDTVTNSEGYFSKTINTCQAEGNEIEVRIRVLAKNKEFEIVGKNRRNLGSVVDANISPRAWSYNNGNVMDSLHIGLLIVNNGPHRAVHLAQAAYRFTNTNSGITLENGLTIRADLSDSQVKINQFIPNWSCGLPVPSSVLDVFADITAIPYSIILQLSNSNKPNIMLKVRPSRTENTTYHEFGHFVMWQLQGKCFTAPLRLTDDGHCPRCHSNPTLAWNEGWPTAFSMMVDNSTYDWDNESDYYGVTSLENVREDYDELESGRGFDSEYLIACAIFDLWDGPDKFVNRPTPVLSSYYNDKNVSQTAEWWQNNEEDLVSLSFQDLCTAITEGDYDAPNNVIESIQGYYKNIIKYRGCEERARIKTVFDQNRIMAVVENFPSGQYFGLSADEIGGIQTLAYGGTFLLLNWYMDFDYEYNVEILDNSNGDYNLGSTTANDFRLLSDDLKIIDGKTLFFNNNIPLGWVNISSPDRPATNSTLQADLCGGITLEAYQGGNIVIGDQAVTAHADVHLKTEGTIILGGPSPTDNGNLWINNNSRLYIDPGATLIIDEGATINLAGNNAVLEIDGNLIIKDNATFTFTGAGHVVWGNDSPTANIVCGPNSKIIFEGSGPTDPILYVKGNRRFHPETSLENLELKNGIISLGDEALISTANADFVLENLDVHRWGNIGMHNGINVHGQANHTISNVEVSEGYRGITAYQMWNQGAVLRLEDCEFHDNDVGLKVHTRGAIMVDCDFHDNLIGYQQEMGLGLSRASSCSFNYNDEGVVYNSAGGDLYFNQSDANYNDYGVRFVGPGSLYGKCSNTNNNVEAGIVLALGASLQFNDALHPTGSQHIATGNKYSLALVFPRSVDLYEGNNDLLPTLQNANRDVYGYMAIPNTTSTTLKAHENHWNTSGGATGTSPNYNSDYLVANLNNGQMYPVYLDDLTPISAPLCSYSTSGSGGSTLRNCGTCGNIETTNFVDVPLDAAIRTAMTHLEITDSTQDDLVAIDLFAEIYAAIPANPNVEEAYLADLVVALAKTAYNGACASGKISTLEVVNGVSADPHIQKMAEILEAVPETGVLSEFLGGLDQAMFNHSQGFIDSTLIQLDTLLQNGVADFQDYLDYADCYVEAENQVLAGLFPREDFDAQVAFCASNKLGLMSVLNTGRLERFAAGLANQNRMQVYPIPASGSVWIDLSCPGASKEPLISVWDMAGRRVELPLKHSTSSGQFYRYELDTKALSAGIYFVKAHTGNDYLSRKIMIN